MSYDYESPASSSLFSGGAPGGLDFGSGASGGAGGVGGDLTSADSAELQQFLALEQQKATMRAQIHAMTEICWEKCVGQPGPKLDSKTESCLDNCAQRFVDVTLLVTQRFANLLQKQAGM